MAPSFLLQIFCFLNIVLLVRLHVWNEFVSRYNFFCLDIPCCCCCLMSCDKKYISIFQFYKSRISIFLWSGKSFPSELKTLLSTFQFCFCVTELCCQLKSGLRNHAMKTNSFFFFWKKKKISWTSIFWSCQSKLIEAKSIWNRRLNFFPRLSKKTKYVLPPDNCFLWKKYLFTFAICVCKLLKIIRIIEDKWKLIHSTTCVLKPKTKKL